jgi:uncharacterized protein (TIGR03437 family)
MKLVAEKVTAAIWGYRWLDAEESGSLQAHQNIRLTLLSPVSWWLLLIIACPVGVAQVQDFGINTGGPHHVAQGRDLFFSVKASIIAGVDESGTVPSLSGLPRGATGEFVDMARYCCGNFLYRLEQDNPVKISTSSTTPTGMYPVQVIYTTPEGLQRSAAYTIFVDPVPIPSNPMPITTTPPLIGYDRWKANAASYGIKHCTPTETAQFAESTVSYYDGARVYYQISDLMGDHSFDTCAGMVYSAYSTYLKANNGGIPGYHVFPHGLAMRYQRANDSAARQTLSTVMADSPYTEWPNSAYMIDWSASREVSYGIETNLVDQSLGGTLNPHFQDLVEALFGHFDQWFVSKSAPIVQPFMVALAAEAMIAYYDKTQDPRVLPMLQVAADQLWTQSWNAACQCFKYYQDTPPDPTVVTLSNDLNGLIAPLYGWVFQHTGLTVYRDEGDQIFNAIQGSQNGQSGNVLGAWLDGGKQFSQTYRWSGKYVEWRSAPTLGVAFTSPTTGVAYTTSNSPVAVTGTVSGPNVVQVTWTSDHGGNGTATGTSTWSASAIALQAGSNQITVTAHDNSGNQVSATLLIILSTQSTNSPTINITSPTSGPTFASSSNTINLAGTASDTTTQVNWSLDQGGQGQAIGTTTWTVNGIALQNGPNRITVTAYDALGNQKNAQITVLGNYPAIRTTSLPPGKVGKFYSYQLSADGIPPFSWSTVQVPDGLIVSHEGLITGTPATAGMFTLDLVLRDSTQGIAFASVSMQVDMSLVIVSAGSLRPGPVAPGSMATAFGSQLAPTAASATAIALPTQIGECSVMIRDASGVNRAAGLYYVSPDQINFTIPADTAVGPALISVYNGELLLATGGLNVVAVAPALFFMNNDGLAAAGLVRVKGDSYDYEPAVQLDERINQFVAVPIDLGSDTDQVYLTLYGTGFRSGTSLDSVQVYICSTLVPLSYVGASGIFEGLDIVNVRLPLELRGKGTVDISLWVGGAVSNSVQVLIQ